jgi:uncharacterized membrane protein
VRSFAILRIKTLGAGSINTDLALLVVHSPVRGIQYAAAAVILGCLSYGVSVMLDAYARALWGATREVAYFATAPLIGVLGSRVSLGERRRWIPRRCHDRHGSRGRASHRECHGHIHAHGGLEHELRAR